MDKWTAENYKKEVSDNISQMNKYIDEVNLMLENKTAEGILHFISVFKNEEFIEKYPQHNEKLLYALLFARITEDEIKMYKKPVFIMNGKSLDELINISNQFKFLIWEMKFEISENIENEIATFIKTYFFTLESIRYLIMTAAIDTPKIIEKMNDILRRDGDIYE